MRLFSSTSRLRALAISVLTHSLLMLLGERISSSRSCTRMASSICSCSFLPPCTSCGANQQRTPLAWRSAYSPLGKELVCARIADEAGIELDRAAHGADNGNKLVAHSRAPQENVWNSALRSLNGVKSDCRRPLV